MLKASASDEIVEDFPLITYTMLLEYVTHRT